MAGIVAAGAGATPTTVGWANVAWLLVVGVGSVLAASRAPFPTLLFMAIITTVVGSTGGLVSVLAGVLALAAVVGVHASGDDSRRRRLLGALAGLFSVWVLVRQDPWGFHGASALVAMVALGPVWWFGAGRRAAGSLRRLATWSPRRRRTAAALLVAPVVLLVVAVALSLWAASQVQASVASAGEGRTGEGSEQLARASAGFSVSHVLVSAPLAPLRIVPVLSQHLELLERTSDEGIAIAEVGTKVLDVANYEDLKRPDGGIDLEHVRSLVEPVDQAEARLITARRRLADSTSPWLVAPVQDRLGDTLAEVDQTVDEVDLIGEAARVAPDMLGGTGERIWFVAFVNPAEERGGGGFLGSYAEIRADDGRLRMTRSGSVLDLIGAAPPGARSIDGPADYVARYGRHRPADFFQDVPFSPHFPYTADVISQLYPQSGGTELDGVMSVDPYALAALLQFTGPIAVEGLDEPLTSENAARTILRDQYVDFDADVGDDQSARRDVLGDAASKTFRALIDGALPSPRALGEALAPMVHQRRLQIHARRPHEQHLIDGLGATGAMLADEPGDYLMVSHQNRGNSKIDAFLFRSTVYEATYDPGTGQVQATVTIELVNFAPAQGLPDYVIGNARGEPVGSNVMTLSVYSHLAAQGATVDGAPVSLTSGAEADARVVSLPVVVPPEGVRTVVVHLRGQLDPANGGYRLRVVPQATVVPDELSVDVRTSGPDPHTVGLRPMAVFDRPEVLGEADRGR